ncbi:hypothetical protein [Mycoplasma sp. SG1]|uniref:hypothetical protein n=1 Tax=Mycoplasma sp. SG1 TaxID=2810348 RepID=UPI0020252A0E|nr:hypothetical protein [Mycoplasma sp. SG1]URM53025.1 hypothetical protein JRW51_01620 [Mycoplasma sp. SG1]
MINFKKRSKYILTTAGLTLASLGIFAGCGNSGSPDSSAVDKKSIKKTVDNLFQHGITYQEYGGFYLKNSIFNVALWDDSAIKELVTHGTKTNDDTSNVDLSVSSVITYSVFEQDDGSKIIEATLLINDADIPAPHQEQFTNGDTNPANNFIYTIAYDTNQDGDVTGFAPFGYYLLNEVEADGDGLIRSNNLRGDISYNTDWKAGQSFDPKTNNTTPDGKVQGVPLLDNRVVFSNNQYIDNGPDHLLSLGNAFYLAAKDQTDHKLGFLDDVTTGLPSKINKSSFYLTIGYTKDLKVLVDKLGIGNGYNWSITSSQLSFSSFYVQYIGPDEQGIKKTVYAPIVSSSVIHKVIKDRDDIIKYLGFYGAVDFQYSSYGSNGYIGYKVWNLGLFPPKK